MAKRGIKAKIDLAELEKLCAMQATDEEIGAFFGVSGRTILRRKKVKKFAEVMERGKAKGTSLDAAAANEAVGGRQRHHGRVVGKTVPGAVGLRRASR